MKRGINQFIEFVRKEFFHILRDGRTMLILFVLPVMQVLLFGFALTNEVKNAKIAIVDYSNSSTSKKVISRFSSSGYFVIKKYLNSVNEIEEEFKNGEIQMVLVFSSNFESKLYREANSEIQLISDASDLNTANTLQAYAKAIIAKYNKEINASEKISGIDIRTKMMYNQNLKAVFLFIPGVMALVLMIISAMLTAVTLAKEKEMGTYDILVLTPLKPITIIIGKVTPYFLLSVFNSVLIISMGIFVFGLPIRGNIISLLLHCVLFATTALSLGILISTKSKTQQEAMFISLISLMLPTILLTGFIFPIESMAIPLQYISKILPATWFIDIVRTIMIKGLGIEFYFTKSLILILMTLLFIGLGISNLKVRGDK